MRRTDKEMLAKGIRLMMWTVLLMFAGPTIIYQAFKNEGHPMYYPVLIVGFIVAVFAIFLAFRGLRTIMNAVFGKKSK